MAESSRCAVCKQQAYRMSNKMKFTVEMERETDGRWIAEVLELPGVMVYGRTAEEALASVQALALRVVCEGSDRGARG